MNYRQAKKAFKKKHGITPLQALREVTRVYEEFIEQINKILKGIVGDDKGNEEAEKL